MIKVSEELGDSILAVMLCYSLDMIVEVLELGNCKSRGRQLIVVLVREKITQLYGLLVILTFPFLFICF